MSAPASPARSHPPRFARAPLGQGGQKFRVNLNQDVERLQQSRNLAASGNRPPASSEMFPDYLQVKSDCMEFISCDNKLDRNLTIRYNLESPSFEISQADSRKVVLQFDSQSYQNSEEFQKIYGFFLKNQLVTNRQHAKPFQICVDVQTRNERDLIILSTKCFALKNSLIYSQLIKNFDVIFTDQQQKLFAHDALGASQSQKLTGDLILEIEQLKQEIQELLLQIQKLKGEKDYQTQEIQRLELELKDTIEVYQNIIQTSKQTADQAVNPNDQTIHDWTTIQKRSNEVIQMKQKIESLQQDNSDLKQNLTKCQEQIQQLQT